MALFTGLEGDHESALRKFEEGQAYLERQKNRKAHEAWMRRGGGHRQPRLYDTDPSGDMPNILEVQPPTSVGLDTTASRAAQYKLDQAAQDRLDQAHADAAGLDTGTAPAPTETTPAPVETTTQQEIDPNLPPAWQALSRLWTDSEIQKAIMDIRTGVATGKYPGRPATNPLSGFINWLFVPAGSRKHADREAAMKAADWIRTDAFADLIRSNSHLIDEANKDPFAFYARYGVPGAKPPDPHVPDVKKEEDPAALHSLARNAIDNMEQSRLLEMGEEGEYTQTNLDRDMLLNLAQEIGVDPATALTIWGIETNFSAVPEQGPQVGVATSEKRRVASGAMQVTDATFESMKKYFSDWRNYHESILDDLDGTYLLEIANRMERGNPESEYAAGLMRMKYSEIVGVPPQNWGAAYQSSAEKVLDNGGPRKGVTDGITSNIDYNKAFNQLRAKIRRALGEKDVVADEVEITTLPDISVKATQPVKTVSTRATARAVTTSSDKKLSQPKTYKSKVALPIINEELAAAKEALAQVEDLAGIYRHSGDAWKYREAINTRNNLINTVNNFSQQLAINMLEHQNDPRRYQQILSVQGGYPEDYYAFIPRSDGNWNILANGELIYENYTTKSIVSSARHALSLEWTKAVNAARSEMDAEWIKAQWEVERDAIVKDIENQGKAAIAKYEAENKIVVDGQGGIWIRRGYQLIHMKTGEVLGPDDTRVPGIEAQTYNLPGSASNMNAAKTAYGED